jgi:hypothetical protein
MISSPTKTGKKINIDLSLFLNIAIMLTINPINPKAAMTKVVRWIEYCIFVQIKMIKTILMATDHLPNAVFGKMVNLIDSPPNSFTTC